MALLRHQGALDAWASLLEAVSHLVSSTHLADSAVNDIISPQVAHTIFILGTVRSARESVGAELTDLLARRFQWSGDRFANPVAAMELLSALKMFRVVPEHILGRGAYARVLLAKNQLTGETVVLKNCVIESDEHGMPLHILRELALLKKMNHPHIVRLYDVLYRPNEVILSLEFLDCNLRELLRDTGALSVVLAKSFTHQLLQGLAYAKAKRCMHRDLKPANVLVLPKQGIVKIADFGLGRAHDFDGGKYTRQVMTLRYRAPEIMLGVREYGAAVDIWSVGCIMAEMLLGVTPFQGDCEVDQLMKIFEALGRPSVQQWPELAHCEHFHDAFPSWHRPADMSALAPGLDAVGLNLLESMLEYDPSKRISADAALQHPWFHDVQLPMV